MRGDILVIRGGAIGDFILTLPALAALRAAFPEARIEILGYPHIAALAQLGGLADAVRPIEAQALAGFFARGGTLAEEMRDYFAGFSIILSYLYDPDGIFDTNVNSCTSAQFIAGPHRPNEADGRHASAVFLQPLARLAIFNAPIIPQLTWPNRMPPAGKPRLALHPGSGSARKNWPLPQWEKLVRRIMTETDWNIMLTGGEAEGQRLEQLAGMVPQARRQLKRHVPLPELAVDLAACRAFMGHDSGITHLAAAVGVPTLALWGPTQEAVWRPLGRQVKILRHAAGLAALSSDCVFQELADWMR